MNTLHEIKVGVFVLASVVLLLYLLMWLNKFELGDDMRIYARFKDAGSLSSGSNVLYRGVKAGIVEGILLTKDQEYSLVKIRINNKSVSVYEEDRALILDKGFTGNKVVSIIPSENKLNKIKVKNQGIINGDPSFTVEELEKALTQMNNDGSLDNMLLNISKLLETTTVLSEKADRLVVRVEKLLSDENTNKLTSLIDKLSILSVNLNKASIRVNSLLGDKTIGHDLKTTIVSTRDAMNKLNTVADKANVLVDNSTSTVKHLDNTIGTISNATTKLGDTLNNPELVGKVGSSLQKMSEVLSNVTILTKDGELKVNVRGPINEKLNELNGLNCVTTQLSKTLNKSFLLPRLFFGRPGRGFSKCINPKDCKDNNETKTDTNNILK